MPVMNIEFLYEMGPIFTYNQEVSPLPARG
jgi:hypothetical protein